MHIRPIIMIFLRHVRVVALKRLLQRAPLLHTTRHCCGHGHVCVCRDPQMVPPLTEPRSTAVPCSKMAISTVVLLSSSNTGARSNAIESSRPPCRLSSSHSSFKVASKGWIRLAKSVLVVKGSSSSGHSYLNSAWPSMHPHKLRSAHRRRYCT